MRMSYDRFFLKNTQTVSDAENLLNRLNGVLGPVTLMCERPSGSKSQADNQAAHRLIKEKMEIIRSALTEPQNESDENQSAAPKQF